MRRVNVTKEQQGYEVSCDLWSNSTNILIHDQVNNTTHLSMFEMFLYDVTVKISAQQRVCKGKQLQYQTIERVTAEEEQIHTKLKSHSEVTFVIGKLH